MRRLGQALSVMLCASVVLATGCVTALDRARSAHTAQEYGEAESYYAEAIAEPKTKTEAKAGLAAMFSERAGTRERTDPASAEADYRRALDVDAVHDQALTGLVRLLRKQGRTPDAAQVLRDSKAAGDCKPCERLEVVVLLDRAQQEVTDGLWDLAIVHFGMAQDIRASAGVAVSIANAQMSKKTPADAAGTLEEALVLIPDADEPTRAAFASTRDALFEGALVAGDFELAERARLLILPGEATRATELAIRIADTLVVSDVDAALVRYEALLAQTEPALAAPQHKAIQSKVARIYANRGTARLQAGAGEDAEAAFAKAIAADPDDWSIRLQRIVAISAQIGAGPALQSLDKVPGSTLGLDHTRAILLSLQVRELVAQGNLLDARIRLAEAEKANADLPEVHLAAATLLAATPVDSLDRRERKAALGRTCLVDYDRKVLRFGEALAELQWIAARKASGKKSLFTAPWLEPSVAKLERELKSVYPFEAKFRADPEPVIVLQNTSNDFLDVTVRGPDGTNEELGLAPQGERTVSFATAGLVRLKFGRTKKVFVAEGYASIVLSLP